MDTFYLVRHAHAHWTPDEDRPLSARGQEDAVRVADILQMAPIEAIFTSPYRRARQTIAPLAVRLNLPLQEVHDLRERRLSAGFVDVFAEAVEATWRDKGVSHPGGESNAAAQRRGAAVVNRLREQQVAEHVVLSTHGNLLALILQYFDPSVDFAFWQSLTMPDIYSLSWSPTGPAVIRRLWPVRGSREPEGSEEFREPGEHGTC
jgi:2,3-bisphosphoglycerate-dependent phosphoglycerate mutase